MEQQLKQRLIGAVVLVSLAVIFVPLILEGPDDELIPQSHDIPTPPELDYRASMDLQLPEADVPEPSSSATAPATPEPAPEPEPEPASQPEIATTRLQQPESAQVEAPQPEPPAAAAKPPRSDAPAPGWYAQLGSFGQQANAAALRDTLGKAGFAAQLQMVDTGKGTSYRVLAGPEPDRASAESLLRKLGDRMKTTGIVIEIGAAGG